MLCCVGDLLQVVTCKDGVLQAMQIGKGYVDMSTVDAATSLEISEVSRQLQCTSESARTPRLLRCFVKWVCATAKCKILRLLFSVNYLFTVGSW